MLVQDLVDVITESVTEYVMPIPCITIALNGYRNSIQGNGDVRDIIYVPERHFHDLDDLFDRIKQGNDLRGVLFAGQVVKNKKEFIQLLVDKRLRGNKKLLIRHPEPQISITFDFIPEENIVFGMGDIYSPPWRWRSFPESKKYIKPWVY